MPLHKGNSDKCECSNSRGISLLGVVCRLYGKARILKVRAGTECAIGKGQYFFRQGKGSIDQVFGERKVCEKNLANGKDVLCTFLDLEKGYDTIDRNGICQMLRVYGVGGN